MCGFCGVLHFDAERPVLPSRIARMCDTLVHRGPDDSGVYVRGPVGLGSRRLSIIDVDGGRMPIGNEDGSVQVVYNGEIYNFAELRRRLVGAGHVFATRSDTETIVHLYEDELLDFACRLNGMFALAIWDARRQRLVLARDPIGVKPLYYAVLDDRLVFGSEIRALLADGVSREIDRIALHDYLSLNYVPGPRTIFSAIRKLPPGHLLTCSTHADGVTLRRYWEMPRQDPTTRGSIADLEDEVLDLLRRAVRDQMVSDVPLGAFLSGGVDSSLVVALMAEVSHRPIKTFTLGFEEESYSEIPHARRVAERFGTEHNELVLTSSAETQVLAMAQSFDEPFADSSSLAAFAVSELAARHVKVALSGDGGDELFGGYQTYQADRIARLYRRLPEPLTRRFLPALADRLPTSDGKASLPFKFRRFVSGGAQDTLGAHYAWKAYLSEAAKAELYAHTTGASAELRETASLLRAHHESYTGADWLNRLLHVDLKVQLVDDMLTKVDRTSMAHSLEVRVPLLDLRLVDFMARLPSSVKVRRLTTKYLLKRVAARLLPHEILTRPKAGFTVPVAAWIRTDLRELVHDALSPETVRRQGIFRPDAIQAMLGAHQRRQRNHSHNIWTLLMFSLWWERMRSVPAA